MGYDLLNEALKEWESIVNRVAQREGSWGQDD